MMVSNVVKARQWLPLIAKSPKKMSILLVIIIYPMLSNVLPSLLCCWLYHSSFKARLSSCAN